MQMTREFYRGCVENCCSERTKSDSIEARKKRKHAPFAGLKHLLPADAIPLWKTVTDSASNARYSQQSPGTSLQALAAGTICSGATLWTHCCHFLQTSTGRYGFAFGAIRKGGVGATVAGMSKGVDTRSSSPYKCIYPIREL